MVQYLGLWVLLALSLNMWALLSVLGSTSRLTSKVVWAAILLCLPLIGFLGWFLIGPRSARA